MPDDLAPGRIVELELPARPEFVGIARMAVAALAGVRPGLAYERIDDLKIVVSEAFTGAVEQLGERAADVRLVLRCTDGDDALDICMSGPAQVFGAVLPNNPAGNGEGPGNDLRISLISALVDEAALRAVPGGSELRLVMKRQPGGDLGDDELEPEGPGGG